MGATVIQTSRAEVPSDRHQWDFNQLLIHTTWRKGGPVLARRDPDTNMITHASRISWRVVEMLGQAGIAEEG